MKLWGMSSLFDAIARRRSSNPPTPRHATRLGLRKGTYPRLWMVIDDERGSMYVLLALSMTVILGFVGLGIDVTSWYAERRVTQNIADSAAVGGTYASLQNGDGDAIQAAADREATRNGYVSSPGNSLIATAVASPETPSVITPRVNVTVSRHVPLFFAVAILNRETTIINARAVGGTRGLGPLCVIALDPTASRALNFTGNTEARIGCGVAANSRASDALYIGGSAILEANPAQAVGDIEIGGSAELVSTFPPLPHSPPVADPLAARTFPATPATVNQSHGLNVDSHDTVNLAPTVTGGSYHITGDVDVRGTLNLAPGTYYIDGGDLTINSQAVVSGSGVTIVMTGSSGTNVGEVRINGGAQVNLSAPSAGPFQGIVFYQDRIADTSGDNRFNGGSTMHLQGAIYFPNQPLDFNGGNDAPGCTQLVSRTVSFSGNSYIHNTPQLCTDVGLTPSLMPSQEQVVLVQ